MGELQNYFLGCVSADGFNTDFKKVIEQSGYYTYILKGGPGTGKSTLMKKIAENYKGAEKYYCSSDMKSLDAVVLNDKKIIVVDGTSPHVFDPDYPAVSQEIVNLGDCWDKSLIQKRADMIKYLTDENKAYHKKSARYIKAVCQINSDIYDVSSKAINISKLSAYKDRLCKKIFSSHGNGIGKVDFKQLSAMTSDGYVTHNIDESYTVFSVKDNYFSGGDYLLKEIVDYAVLKKYDVIVSKFSLLPTTVFEHVLIPELKVAFLTDNFVTNLDLQNDNQINFSRFYDKEIIDQFKNRINFNKKAVSELVRETAVTIETALDIHNQLEVSYINAIDFKKLNKIAEKLISEID